VARTAGRFASRLTVCWFLQPTVHRFLARRTLFPCLDRNLGTAFLSPETAALSPKPPFQGRCSWPTPSVANRPLPSPFGFPTLLPLPVRPSCGRFLAESPLLAPGQSRLAAPPVFAPLRGFCPPQDQRNYRYCRRSARLLNPPDSLRSPSPFSISSSGNGSSFRVRYVFKGLLFLKPLGTNFTMRPLWFCGQDVL
jgi:hypothetical protein